MAVVIPVSAVSSVVGRLRTASSAQPLGWLAGAWVTVLQMRRPLALPLVNDGSFVCGEMGCGQGEESKLGAAPVTAVAPPAQLSASRALMLAVSFSDSLSTRLSKSKWFRPDPLKSLSSSLAATLSNSAVEMGIAVNSACDPVSECQISVDSNGCGGCTPPPVVLCKHCDTPDSPWCNH